MDLNLIVNPILFCFLSITNSNFVDGLSKRCSLSYKFGLFQRFRCTLEFIRKERLRCIFVGILFGIYECLTDATLLVRGGAASTTG